ncbi:MAG: 16S rRNA (adenine(1518)-N(6)/adenine(1519)-N(6))-dimethyltransferase RsmA [Muribaculaceae bacterium]|nr:16S rRNA (adenine(1518)-N(6)/adenine(1519)-N(6))-dimethyltransferase RsmA [Muribaculaceae bacterium]
MQVRAKKSLGQHFLTDLNVAERIARTLDGCDMPVLEVGPGMGVLTQFLIEQHHDLRVVELDQESVDYLQVHFPQLQGRIIEADFLQLDLRATMGHAPFAVIGNYPYNISSQILFKVLEHKDQVPVCSGMFQREVAQRVASGPGSKDYGILSVLLQVWYDIEYLFTVDEHVFNPPPKVKSGVIRLTRNKVTHPGCDERLLQKVVKAAFGQRRKMLRNSMRSLFPPNCPELSDPLFNRRPEQMSVQDFIGLTNRVAEYQPSKTTAHEGD